MNAKEYAIVIKSICSQLGDIIPDDTLIRNVTLYCKSLNQTRIRELHPLDDDFYAAIVKSYINSIAPNNEFYYNEYARKQDKKDNASLVAIENAKQAFEPLTNWFGDRMPIVSSKSMSIYIDSRVRNVSSSPAMSIANFEFSLVPRLARSDIGDGSIQVRVMPSQITYFKIGKVILPYNSILRQRNYSNEITLTFAALRSNGIIGREDTYHFSFTYMVSPSNSQLIELLPVDKYCKFSPPLRIVDDLTLRFNDPIYPISFDNDRMIPSQFNYQSTDGRIAFSSPHNLNTNDVIIVNGLTTNSDAHNSTLLATINDPRGIVITTIDQFTVSTGIDFTQITHPDINSMPTILFYSKMFRFPLEIGYQDVVDL